MIVKHLTFLVVLLIVNSALCHNELHFFESSEEANREAGRTGHCYVALLYPFDDHYHKPDYRFARNPTNATGCHLGYYVNQDISVDLLIYCRTDTKRGQPCAPEATIPLLKKMAVDLAGSHYYSFYPIRNLMESLKEKKSNKFEDYLDHKLERFDKEVDVRNDEKNLKWLISQSEEVRELESQYEQHKDTLLSVIVVGFLLFVALGAALICIILFCLDTASSADDYYMKDKVSNNQITYTERTVSINIEQLPEKMLSLAQDDTEKSTKDDESTKDEKSSRDRTSTKDGVSYKSDNSCKSQKSCKSGKSRKESKRRQEGRSHKEAPSSDSSTSSRVETKSRKHVKN